ncbi:hypothetical protein FSARC_12099 [Fusarium sarcochroum]|uniref:Starter acyltransferase (SAT) domain-containing protein n=1 Tax=Fusarium sarcochroum TaxID=1208366 RepID=A0A8H4TB10_9HYPO|nr:hypothetical protein FSARC_12099 [Fusarium sarcochroum]
MTASKNLPSRPMATIPIAKLNALHLSPIVPFPLVGKPHDVTAAATCVELSSSDSSSPTDEVEDEDAQSLLELTLEYANQVVEMIRQSGLENLDAHRESLKLLIDYLEQTVLATRNIHLAVASFSISGSEKSKLLRSYYDALHAADISPSPQKSGLFGITYSKTKSTPATIYTVFGGQGLRGSCIEELGELMATYPSLTRDLIQDSTILVNELLKTDTIATQLLPQGLNILAWLHDPSQVPESSYLASAPVNVPLIGLVQLAHYEVTCKTLGYTPGQFRSRIAGTTGHSQGIITAAATAVADDWLSWREVTRAAMTTLFWIGVRTQQSWDALQGNNAVSEAMIQDSVDHGERTPSPMLSVRGLPREDLQTCVDATNRYLKDGSRYLEISIVNGTRNFVVSGPPKYLYGLNLRIRKRKQLFTQQSSSGKADVIGSTFLDVSVPFHTDWLSQALPMIQDDLEHVRLHSNDMTIPVFSPESGQDVGRQGDHESETNVLHKLVELVVSKGIDWDKATAYLHPEPTLETQNQTVIDFGPGGIHGISSLSSSIGGSRAILAGTLSGGKAGVGCKEDLYK